MCRFVLGWFVIQPESMLTFTFAIIPDGRSHYTKMIPANNSSGVIYSESEMLKSFFTTCDSKLVL